MKGEKEMKEINMAARWQVVYRHTEDGKHMLRVSHSETSKRRAQQDASQAGENYDVMPTPDVLSNVHYREW